jgi:hypothetical protein
MGLRFEHVTKLAHSKEGLRAAYAAGVDHQRNGWLRYPPCKWDHPAILAELALAVSIGARIMMIEPSQLRLLRVRLPLLQPLLPYFRGLPVKDMARC